MKNRKTICLKKCLTFCLSVVPAILRCEERNAISFQQKFFDMLFWLTVSVIALIILLWALKLVLGTRTGKMGLHSKTLKQIDSLPLSSKLTLHLVKVENHTVLVAESETTTLVVLPHFTEQIH